MAISDQQIFDWFLANPGADDATIASTMDQFKVSPADVARATGTDLSGVQSRYQAATPATTSVPFVTTATVTAAPVITSAPVTTATGIATLTTTPAPTTSVPFVTTATVTGVDVVGAYGAKTEAIASSDNPIPLNCVIKSLVASLPPKTS